MEKKGSALTRRQFFRRAAGAAAGMAAFPYIIPGSALGLDGAVAPSNRITLASIGVGGMGTANLNEFLEQKGAQVLAVCDVDTAHREAAAKAVNGKYGNQDCAQYNDFREVLARPDIDAVALALPDHWHGVIGVWAARAGKDIYGEKPLAYNISEGRAVGGRGAPVRAGLADRFLAAVGGELPVCMRTGAQRPHRQGAHREGGPAGQELDSQGQHGAVRPAARIRL